MATKVFLPKQQKPILALRNHIYVCMSVASPTAGHLSIVYQQETDTSEVGVYTPVANLLFFATHMLASHMHLTCLYVMDACVEQYMLGDIQLLHSLCVGTQHLQQQLSPPPSCVFYTLEVHATIDLLHHIC